MATYMGALYGFSVGGGPYEQLGGLWGERGLPTVVRAAHMPRGRAASPSP